MACTRLIYLQTCDILGAIAPYAALIITHLSVVSSRQRSYGRLRCENDTKIKARNKNILRLVVKKSPTGESTHYFFHSQDDKVEVSC